MPNKTIYSLKPGDPLYGLTAAEVEESRKKYGSNLLTPPERPAWWILYLEKFKDPIIRILIIAALTALIIGLKDGHYIEGIGILAAILLSTGLSFANEYKAGKEFDILNRVSDEEEIEVIREGRHTLVPKYDLVVGDIIQVAQGAELPADAEVMKATSFTVNESSLTGESLPVEKKPAPVRQEQDGKHSYPSHLAYRGTTVSEGHAVLKIFAVGDASEIGKTAKAAAETPETVTPLTRQLERLASLIGVGAFLAAAVIFVALAIKGWYSGEIHANRVSGGHITQVPLAMGQWYAFALLGVVLLILCAQIWLPVVEDGLGFLTRKQVRLLPGRIDGGRGFVRLLAAAAFVAVVGLLCGSALDLIDGLTPGQWLPMPAVTAFLRYFMVAVTVIVVSVPEGLPMCVTLALAYSMRKMTATNNLVRKMHACETIGAATVICSDKTGTLTMNEMRVNNSSFDVLDQDEASAPALRVIEGAAVNATANLDFTSGKALALGNPTEGALLLWLADKGHDYEALRNAFQLRRQLTFSTERKFMATAGLSGIDAQPVLYAKGAPEIILGFCTTLVSDNAAINETTRQAILAAVAEQQNRGMRIIAMAHREAGPDELDREIDPELTSLAWDGFFAIADPIREEVPDAIATALKAGIAVKIVTGDNQLTAREIASQAGLWRPEDDDDNIITGDAFMELPDEEAAGRAEKIKVMSRARPLNKLRLVKLLQEQGEVVAVTGDGTNDAPALNHADVGLAMGKTGTSVAKEAADIILLDDSFNSIVNAVSWGRSLYANIQKFIVFQLTINVAAVGIALLGPSLGAPLPLPASQLLPVSLIMDTFAALALASEPPDWKLMDRPPRKSSAFIINPQMKQVILGVGLTFLLMFVALILGFSDVFPMDGATAAGRHNQTLFFTAFVFLQFWNLFNARAFGSTSSALAHLQDSKGFLTMAGVILVGQILLVQFGGEVFRVTPMSITEWLAAIALTSPVLWVGEISRWVKRRKSAQNAQA